MSDRMTFGNTVVDISLYTRGMNGLVDFMKGKSKVITKKETGELVKTLIKLTPRSSSKKVSADIMRKFETVADAQLSNRQAVMGRAGKDGVIWISVDSKFLKGVAPEKDMTGASVDELKAVMYTLTKSAKAQSHQFKHPRRQRVLIYQTILTKASTVKKLAAEKVKNVGRLPAGWLPGWDKLNPTGANMPPKSVMRHKVGARGYFIDAGSSGEKPFFVICNQAAGVGNPKNNVQKIAQIAVDVRGKAMAANLKLLKSGKRRVADYA